MKKRVIGRCEGCGASVDLGGESLICGECTQQKYEEVFVHRVSFSPEFQAFKALLYGSIVLFITLSALPAFASPEINPAKLCDAIYKAEGGAKTKHPYGIMQKYKHTSPRQACLNTVKSAQKRYKKDSKGLRFIPFLGATYCPLSDSRDVSGLNKNWVRNVEAIYASRSMA